LLKKLKVAGLLSFGPEGVNLPLRDLNVFIGPNGSGKSNFLEILALLKAAPGSLPDPVKVARRAPADNDLK
jgi:predicted ATPase